MRDDRAAAPKLAKDFSICLHRPAATASTRRSRFRVDGARVMFGKDRGGSDLRAAVPAGGGSDGRRHEEFLVRVTIFLRQVDAALAGARRDIAEDSRRGRIDLPAEDLDRFGDSGRELRAQAPNASGVAPETLSRAASRPSAGAVWLAPNRAPRAQLTTSANPALARSALRPVDEAYGTSKDALMPHRSRRAGSHCDRVAIDYAFSGEFLLAPGGNGRTLLRVHGFPPRYYSFKSVKWISELRLVRQPCYRTWPKAGVRAGRWVWRKAIKTPLSAYTWTRRWGAMAPDGVTGPAIRSIAP